MKSENDAPPIRSAAPPALMAGATAPVELLGPALAEFPDAVVITNCEREVVFLNGAAKKLFGETLGNLPGSYCKNRFDHIQYCCDMYCQY